MKTNEIVDRHVKWVDNIVGNFEGELKGVVHAAQAKVLGYLQENLAIENGQMLPTAGNRAVLRRVGAKFIEAMSAAGYSELVDSFAKTFSGNFSFFDQSLQVLADQGIIKSPNLSFAAGEQAALRSQLISLVGGFESVVDGIAARAVQKALLGVGALKFSDLVELLSNTFGKTLAEATTLGTTAQTMFYRQITANGFAVIESDESGTVYYRLVGPIDKLIRPWCLKYETSTVDSPLTRPQIEALNNGQLPNPFITCGGYNCRHQWVLDSIK